MSISARAIVIYGYTLSSSELVRRTPHPLWGTHRFDPQTGDKVTQFIETDIDLGLDSGENLPGMTRFTRFDIGHEGNHPIVLGIKLAQTGDLMYGYRDPAGFALLSDADCFVAQEQVKKLLDKAGLKLDPSRIGYYLAGYAG